MRKGCLKRESYYYIDKQRMVSTTAQRSYRAAAGLSLALFFLLFFIAAAVQVVAIPEAFLPVVKLLLFVGVLGAATTMVVTARWPAALPRRCCCTGRPTYLLFSFDNSSDLQKCFWFCVMLFPYEAMILTPKQAFDVLMHLHEPERTLTLLACATGLRISECLGLQCRT